MNQFQKDNRCTILASLAESEYCKQKNFDPQDPRCAKLIITGKMVKVSGPHTKYCELVLSTCCRF
jgi:hypothetical protein